MQYHKVVLPSLPHSLPIHPHSLTHASVHPSTSEVNYKGKRTTHLTNHTNKHALTHLITGKR